MTAAPHAYSLAGVLGATTAPQETLVLRAIEVLREDARILAGYLAVSPSGATHSAMSICKRVSSNQGECPDHTALSGWSEAPLDVVEART